MFLNYRTTFFLFGSYIYSFMRKNLKILKKSIKKTFTMKFDLNNYNQGRDGGWAQGKSKLMNFFLFLILNVK